MTIAVTTKAELLEQLQAFIASRLPDVVTAADSDIGVLLSMIAEAQYGAHYKIAQIFDDLFVSDRTSTDALDQHADARLVGGRKGATTASGTDAVRVSGTVGATVASGDLLVYSDGSRYQLTEDGTVAGGGTVDVSVESVTTGTVANRSIGDSLTFVETPSGITATAEVVVAIDGAEDAESDGALIARLLDAYKNPPAAGRFSDWRQWATTITGVSSAYAYGPSSAAPLGRRGLGIVDVAILGPGSGSARIPSAAVQTAVEDYIDTQRPACTRDRSVILPTADLWDIKVTVTPQTGYDYDWVDTVGHTVDAWNSGTKTLTWIDTPEAAAGDRILVRGQVATIQSVASKDTVVDIDFSPAPIAADDIYPAGPLSQPCIDAIIALIDTFGPARGTAADPEQIWEDTLRIAGLYDALMDVEGVKDVVVDTPVSNLVPDDTGATIELIIANEITIAPP